ncbi:MAG TPA: BTAD domain-containing putative transcriptional regulator [Gemmatimonadales bacterium]|nr:BTAD domain-containing putative transcriptional regulator [Gemmatimonadales bacterium]
MIELCTLGAVDLRNGDGAELRSVLVQPKRTALLIYLAVAAPRGLHRRDSLLALFWPEQDTPHARSALRQALHGLRHALGDDVVTARGDEEVGLERTQCRCDVWAFEQALDAGDLERAVGRYGGPFLGGFFLGGAPEFERWVEAERERLSRRYATVLEQLAHGAETRGDHAGAVQWWSRLAEHSPYTSRVAVRLMRALDMAGDRAGAIRHADQHGARLRAELDAEPDPEIETLAAQLRSQPTLRVAPQQIVRTAPTQFPTPVAEVAHAARTRFVVRLPALAAGLLLLGLAGWWAINATGAGAPLRRLAVLPLADNTGDSAHQYLVDGVHEAVITELAQIRGLSVVSRSSVMRYRGTAKSVPEIARELNVDALVEGAVFRAEDSIRVTLQLIDARRDRHLWARTFEGDQRHMLSLSREAADALARGARVTFTPQEVARMADKRPQNSEANAAYLRARWHFNTNTGEGLQRSIAFYRQAIALDSTYAAAYAGLADAWVIRGHEFGAPPDAFPQARTIARKALALDEELADAYLVLGHIAFEYDWDWPEAERLLRRAIELSPSNARAHFIYGGGFLIAMARFEEAEREMRLASQLDPLSPAVAAVASYPARFAGRYSAAEAMLRSARQVFPDDQEIQQALGITHELEGRHAEAIAELDSARSPLGLRAWVYGRAGQHDSAVAMLRHLEERGRRGAVSPWQLALAHLSLGDQERALDDLEAAYRGRWREMAWLNVYPYVAPLRGHPRFQALLARMKFPP